MPLGPSQALLRCHFGTSNSNTRCDIIFNLYLVFTKQKDKLTTLYGKNEEVNEKGESIDRYRNGGRTEH